jgi:hypothetical protein
MTSEGDGHPVRMLLPEPGAPLDIGEKEGLHCLAPGPMAKIVWLREFPGFVGVVTVRRGDRRVVKHRHCRASLCQAKGQ